MVMAPAVQRGPCQSVNKPPNRQNPIFDDLGLFFSSDSCVNWEYKRHKGAKMLAAQGILTYCANGRTTVPMYADAARLLVFGAFLTSAGCVKKYFFDRPENLP